MSKYRELVCPLCGSTRLLPKRIFTAAYAMIHFRFTNGIGDDQVRQRTLQRAIERLWQQSTAQVFQCTVCHLEFVVPYVAGDARFYNAIGGGGYPAERFEFKRAYRDIANVPKPKRGRILELGAGSGQFINRVTELLPGSQILATEYYRPARQSLNQRGIKCLGIDVLDLARLNKYQHAFNWVCAFQVIEHMDNLRAVLKACARLTQSGGHLLLSVPNGERIDFNERAGALLDTPPNHVNRFFPQTWEWIAQTFGWELVECEIEPQSSARIAVGTLLYRQLQAKIRQATSLPAPAPWVSFLPEIVWRRSQLGASIYIHLRKL